MINFKPESTLKLFLVLIFLHILYAVVQFAKISSRKPLLCLLRKINPQKIREEEPIYVARCECYW